MRGPTVTVTLNGALVTTWSYNGIVVDGFFGLLTQSGTTSFDHMRIRTNDSAFVGPNNQRAGAAGADAVAPPTLEESALATIVAEAKDRWHQADLTPEQLAALDGTRVVVADLPDNILGQVHGQTVFIDVNAAGLGWFVDGTPSDDEEFPVLV